MSKRRGDRLETSLRLKKVSPMTETQADVFQAYAEGKHLFLYGSAGTGKTFISLALALAEVLRPGSVYKKVIIVRSAVPSRDQGFLPGNIYEKMAAYMAPYIAMLSNLFDRGDAYEILSQKRIVECTSTSHLRGMTFDDCIIIADEVQNYSFEEADTLITRVGNNCKMVICGDLAQTDLVKKHDTTGFPRFYDIIERMEEFECLEFTPDDIVRSGLVKSYILRKMGL